MFKWHLVAAALCLALAPSFAQITFSRSWVPQGKRSGQMGALLPSGSSGAAPTEDLSLLRDSCLEARVATLSQIAEHLVDLLDETTEEDMTHPLRLKHALVARRRKMS